MFATVIVIAAVHAAGVVSIAAVSRSRGWTILAAIVATVIAMKFGSLRDAGENIVAIGLAYWACWRMLPRKRPRRAVRFGSNSFPRTGNFVVMGGAGVIFLVAAVLSVSASRAGASGAVVPAEAFRSMSPRAVAAVLKTGEGGATRPSKAIGSKTQLRD